MNRSQLNLIFRFVLITLTLSPKEVLGQISALKKAEQNQLDKNFNRTAYFNNVLSSKYSKVKEWCKTNGYVITDVKFSYEERFGGNKVKFLSKVSFRLTEHDDFVKARQTNTAASYYSFMVKYRNGPLSKRAQDNFFTKLESINECSKYSKLSPHLKARLIVKAFLIVQYNHKASTASEFLQSFPDTKYERDVQKYLCDFSDNIQECKKYARLHKQIYECLNKKAYAIVKREAEISDYSTYLKTFPNSEKYSEIASLMVSKIDNCETGGKLIETHPELSSEIDAQSSRIALDGGIEIMKSYVEFIPTGYKVEEFKDVIRKDNLEKIRIAELRQLETQRIKREKELAAKSERERRQRQEEQKREERERKIRNNSITSKWLLGDKVCSKGSSSQQLQGVIEKFNSNRSNIQIKILGGVSGLFDGEEINKDKVIWTTSSKWYKCIGDEDIDYTLEKESKCKWFYRKFR